MAKESTKPGTTITSSSSQHQPQHSLKSLSLTSNNMMLYGVKRQAKGILVRRRSSETAWKTEKKSLNNIDSTGDTHRGDEDYVDVVVEDTSTASEGSSASEEDSKRSSNVRFSTIQVRQYPVTIGVNPATEFGPSLELGWKYEEAHPYDVDDYEEDRIAVPRRTQEDLVLSSYQREDLLLELGFTMRQIWNKTHEKDAYRRGVKKSMSKSVLAKVKNAVASIGAEKKRKAIRKKNLKNSSESHSSSKSDEASSSHT
jgi:hypothetical protein